MQFFERLANGKLVGRPDSWSYAAMALAYRRGEQYTSVLQIYKEMRSQSMPIYKDVHFAVLEACERLGLWKEGREALRFIQVRPVLPSCQNKYRCSQGSLRRDKCRCAQWCHTASID